MTCCSDKPIGTAMKFFTSFVEISINQIHPTISPFTCDITSAHDCFCQHFPSMHESTIFMYSKLLVYSNFKMHSADNNKFWDWLICLINSQSSTNSTTLIIIYFIWCSFSLYHVFTRPLQFSSYYSLCVVSLVFVMIRIYANTIEQNNRFTLFLSIHFQSCVSCTTRCQKDFFESEN